MYDAHGDADGYDDADGHDDSARYDADRYDADRYDSDSAVYWRRRGVAIAGVVAVVLFMLWAFSGPSRPESDNQAVPEYNAAGARPMGFQGPVPVAGEPVAPPTGYPLPPSSAQPGPPAVGVPRAGPPAGSPGIASPGAAQPGDQSGAAQPGAAQPGDQSARPGVAQLGDQSARPGVAQPGDQSGAARPGAARPGVVQPGSPSMLPDAPGSASGAPGSASGAPGSAAARGTQVAPGSPAANPDIAADQGRRPVKTRPEPAAVGPCSNRVISVLAQVGAKSYRSGTKPDFKLMVTNVGDVPCTRDLDAGLQEMIVSGPGNERLWSSNDCFPAKAPDVRTLRPGTPQVFTLAWAGRTSKPGCGEQRSAVRPGNYRLVAKLGTLSSGPTPFTIVE